MRYVHGGVYQRKHCDDHVAQARRNNGRNNDSDRREVNGHIMLRRKVDGRTVWVGEHRETMEKLIDRPLLSTEHVVHLNGDKTDNRPENLGLRTVLVLDQMNVLAQAGML